MAGSDPQHRLQRLASELERERRGLDRVRREVGDALALFATRDPTSLELRGAADLLHDFYTGAEKAFELVATTIDGGAPEGGSWHRRLLEMMGTPVGRLRPAVLRAETVAALDEYLRFRHLFRSLYGFELLWERVAPLLEGVAAVHASLDADLDAFIAFLVTVAQ